MGKETVMRKYILPMVGMLAMAMIAPLPVSARSVANAQVVPFSMYEPSDSETNGKLKSELMSGAQAIHVGDKVAVNLTTADYKVFKLAVNARQAVRIKDAESGDTCERICIYPFSGWSVFMDSTV